MTLSTLLRPDAMHADPSARTACTDCGLHQLCLPVGVHWQELPLLDRIVRRHRPVPRGDNIFRAGEEFSAIYAIRSGSVKTCTVTEEGMEQITGFHMPGDIIGLEAIDTGQHPCSAVALESAHVCEIPFSALDELADRIPSLSRQLLRIMSRELVAETALLTLLGRRSAEERLATFLLDLAMRRKARGLPNQELRLSMSRHEIGNYLGLAVETVSRLFTRFQQTGLIRARGKRVDILDNDQLRIMAGLPKPRTPNPLSLR